MENDIEKYDEITDDEMTVDNSHHFISGELLEPFDDSSIDDFITNLNDWD